MTALQARARSVGGALAIAGLVALAMDSPVGVESCTLVSTPAGLGVQVAVASTAGERSVGLSGRDSIPHAGLLLEWPAVGRHPIWMADVRFALDLVWLADDGTVLAVLSGADPCHSAPCDLLEPHGSQDSRAVLELPDGDAQRFGITPGARVAYPPAIPEACAAGGHS